MEAPDIKIGFVDIAKGVVEYAVDEAKLFFHKVTDQFQHEGISSHPHEAPEYGHYEPLRRDLGV